MNRGDISNLMAPHVAVDFDALAEPPEGFLGRMLDFIRSRRRLDRLLLPMTVRWHSLNRDAEVAGWWLLQRDVRISVVVRKPRIGWLPYFGTLVDAVHEVLKDYPSDRFHLVRHEDMHKQAAEIHSFCRANLVLRFYTADAELASCLPSSLACLVRAWDERILSL